MSGRHVTSASACYSTCADMSSVQVNVNSLLHPYGDACKCVCVCVDHLFAQVTCAGGPRAIGWLGPTKTRPMSRVNVPAEIGMGDVGRSLQSRRKSGTFPFSQTRFSGSDERNSTCPFSCSRMLSAGMCKQFTNMARGKPWAKPKSSYNPIPLC